VHHHAPMQTRARAGGCPRRDPPAQGCAGFLVAMALLPTVAALTFLVIELLR